MKISASCPLPIITGTGYCRPFYEMSVSSDNEILPRINEIKEQENDELLKFVPICPSSHLTVYPKTQLFVTKDQIQQNQIHKKTYRNVKKYLIQQWEPKYRWVKYEQVREHNGDKWSTPYVAAISPIFLDKISENLTINHAKPPERYHALGNEENEIFIELETHGSSNLVINYYPEYHVWVVRNGRNSNEMLEIGRVIGAFLSNFSEIQKNYNQFFSVENLHDSLALFKKMSTMIPPNSWNPAVRMEPTVTDKNIIPNVLPAWDEVQPSVFENLGHDEIGGNLCKDIRRKFQYYISDFVDYFKNLSACLSSTIFMFFVVLSPLVTFGALSDDYTNGYIGTIETIIGAGVCGVFWMLL